MALRCEAEMGGNMVPKNQGFVSATCDTRIEVVSRYETPRYARYDPPHFSRKQNGLRLAVQRYEYRGWCRIVSRSPSLEGRAIRVDV